MGARTCILETGSAELLLRRQVAWVPDLALSLCIEWPTLGLLPYKDLELQFLHMTSGNPHPCSAHLHSYCEGVL